MQLSKFFFLEVDMKIERGTLGSQFTEYQRGSSSALLRAEGEKELFPHVPVARHVP